MNENKNPFKEEQTQEEQVQNEQNQEVQDEQNLETEEVQNETPIENEEKDEFKEKFEELNNKYIRLAADFDNFRKRTQSEKEELSKYTTIEILKKLTTVLDTFDRAKEHLKNVENCETVKESYELAHKQLLDALKKIGLSEIEALGQDFNPNEHEAITQVPTDEFAPDTVALVAQKGYKLEDSIVRPALVGVAKEKEE